MVNLLEILAKMNPNQRINYDRVLQQMIKRWQAENTRPTILLHSCCAPCSTATLEYLVDLADVTVYFANHNIHPRAEYERRKIVQEQFIQDFNRQTGSQVQFLAAAYEPNKFTQMVKEKGLAAEKEGGKRCTACFQMRLDIVAQKAAQEGFDYFGSALTLSPKKNSQLINELGIEIQEFFDTRYLPSDFKKNNGYKRSIDLCKEYKVYRQCYCGCLFAAKEQGVDLKAVQKEATAFVKAHISTVRQEKIE